MDYKLVKQLKELGFPQTKYYGGHFLFCSTGKVVHDETNNPTVYEPILEELINECGDEFWGLRINRETRLWRADKVGYECVTAKDEDIITTKGQGKTPLESVANLYIAINKK